MKRIISFALSFLLIITSQSLFINAENVSRASKNDENIIYKETAAVPQQELAIKAKSAILIEPKTGTVLYEMNADEKLPPASVTKIMSLLLVMEAIDKGNLKLDTSVSASEHACSMGGSQIWLEPSENMTVDELLKATVIASANDACVALGEQVAGSEEGFVALMNEKAKKLGMKNTEFKNATGLDAEGHLTTARDIAIMSGELLKYSLIKKYSTVWMDTLRNGESELVNTNKLIRFYKGATGLKTGTTSIAKYCLSASAQRNGMELVAVVLAGETSSDRFSGAKKLLDYGFANYNFEVINHKLKDNRIPVKNGIKNKVSVKCEDSLNILMFKNDNGKIRKDIKFKKEICAPIKKGDTLGTVDVYIGENKKGSLEIKASEDVKKMSVSVVLRLIFTQIFKL